MKNFYFKIILIILALTLSMWLCNATFAMGKKPEKRKTVPQEEAGTGLYEQLEEDVPSEEEINEMGKKRKAREIPEPEEGPVRQILEDHRLGDIELTR